MKKMVRPRIRQRPALLVALAALTACGEGLVDPRDGPGDQPRFAGCDLNTSLMISVVARDAIPSLDDPVWARADDVVPDYLDPDTRIVGIMANGVPHAVPLNVLWSHEIVNLDSGGPNAPKVAITYCPLTGSSLVWDRASVGGATLGVSGVLFMNNLMVYDRRDPDDSLWPQMLSEARCGSRTGATLTSYPSVEMEWDDWLLLHPNTLVVAGAEAQGLNPFLFNYNAEGYPYGDYLTQSQFFNDQIMPAPDTRRFAKERVIGVPTTADESGADRGIAFPFAELTEADGDFQVVDFDHEGETAIVLWSDDGQGGAVFRPVTTDGATVTLEPTSIGFDDLETGSKWSIEGRATSGPMEGARLLPVLEAHTAFWGAWSAFHRNTLLWTS